MKNIFKKNQIIITALAIMIVIAGYLSFTNNDKPDKKDSVESANPDYDIISGTDGEDFVQNTTDIGDDTTTDDTTDTTDTTDDTADDTTDNNILNAEDENDEVTPVNIEDDQELGDISDEDLLAAANEVSDTGELEIDDIPGEAILASTTLDGSFFASKKLEREQDRARSRADLLALIESTNISDASKQPIIERMIELTNIAEIENNIEVMLEARGFADAMVTMNADGDINVVINTPSLSDQQLAIVEDVIMNETNASLDKITINPVIVVD
ncbi:MAG: SpoIIIAH-like family protein [Clostridiales bacterium]|jgi:stage III sporulation protein AH|nr:SpoIIIAH-like family protein [Clostridiales bacterium]